MPYWMKLSSGSKWKPSIIEFKFSFPFLGFLQFNPFSDDSSQTIGTILEKTLLDQLLNVIIMFL